MKKTFTLFKIMRPLLLALCCIFGAEEAMAQYSASLVQKGGWYTALSKDNSGNLLVARYNGTSYELTRWTGGSPVGPTVLANGLANDGTSDYPWGIAVNPTNNDVFVVNPTTSGGQIIRIPGGTGTPTIVQSGNVYSAICFDHSNNLLALEWNSGGSGANGTYRVRRYSSDGSTLLGNVYDGLLAPGDGSYPYAMDVDALGNIYITNFYSNSDAAGEPGLIKLTPPGFAATTIQTGRHFTGLYIDAYSNLYTIEQASAGSSTYQIKKYTDPAGIGTVIYTPLASLFGFYPWGITEINGVLYVNDGAASTDINGVGGANGQLLRLIPPPVNVVSVNRVGTTPTNAASVQFTVTFSGDAANVTTSAFTATGVTGASVTSVASVSGTTYTVTVNTGTGSGTLGLTVTGTSMGNAVTNAPYSAGQTYTIDKTVPTGSVLVNAGAAYTNAAAVNLTLTGADATAPLQMAFSQDNVSYSSYQAFATSASFTFTGADGTKTVYMRLRDGAGNVSTFQDDIILDTDPPETILISGPPAFSNSTSAAFNMNSDEAGSFEISLDGGAYVPVSNPALFNGLAAGPHTASIRAVDQAGNVDGSPYTHNWIIDLTPPSVTQVIVPANDTYVAGQHLDFTVEYNEIVSVDASGGTPSIAVTIGSTAVQATYLSGSGTAQLVFRYTVQAGQADANGITLGTAIALNGGTITDPATNNAGLTLNNAGSTAGVLVDAVAPAVTSVGVPANGYYRAGMALNFTVNFDENVTVTGTPSIPVTIGAATVQATYTGGTGTSALTFSYTVLAGQNDMDGIAVGSAIALNGGTLKDAPGNDATLTLNSIGNTTGVFVNTVIPTVALSGTPVVNGPWTVTITFSEAVIDFVAGDVAVTNGAASNLQTSDNIIYTALITPTADGAVAVNVPANVAVQQTGGNGNAASNTINYTYDGTAPTVVSVTMPGAGPAPSGYYYAGTSLNFTVTASEAVTVTGTPEFDVIIGSTTRQATYVSGSGTSALTFRYTIVDGDNDENGITIGAALQLPAGSSIRDAVGNNIAVTLNGIGDGSSVRINTVHPDVTITPPQTSTVVAPFMITVTFSEQTTDALALADFILSGCTISSLSTTNNISWTGLITPAANAQGAATIQLPADVVHNIATNGNKASAVYNFNYDTKSPAITSITPPADGIYRAGQALTFTITYDDNFTVAGAPTLPIIIGSNTRNAALTGSTANSLTFSYTLADGDVDADGIALGAAIALNGGAIKDAVGHDAALSVSGSYPGILVDATRPVVTSVDVPANGYYRAGQALTFTVHTSENVTVTNTPSIDVIIGATTRKATYTGGNGSSALTFAYTVVAGDNDMDGITLGSAINLDGGSTIQDAVQNDIVPALNSVDPTNNIFVNTTIPTVTLSAPTVLNGPWTMTITFSEAVTGLTISDLSTTNAGLSALSTSDNITYTVNVTPLANGTVTLSLPANVAQNIGGNGNSASNTINYTYDGTAPSITSVNVPANGTYSTGEALSFTVNFNENVAVTGTPSFPVTIGSTTVQATYTGGTGTNALTFAYTVQTGDFDMDGIAVGAAIALNSGTLKDLSGNNAALTLNSIGNTSAVLVDAVAPVITSVAVPANGYYNAGDMLEFTVSFNENIAATGTPAIPVTIGSTTVQATYAAGSGTSALTFRYTVQAGEIDMDGIAVGSALALNGGTLKDGLGNDAALALNNTGNTSNVFVLAIRPTVNVSGAVSMTAPWTATITFSHAVMGFTLADITLTNATASNLQTTDNITYTALISPVTEGGVSIEIPGGAAQDVAGNQNLPSNRLSYYYDPNPPVITSVEVPANGYYRQGDVLNFAINWSEAVRNNVTPTSLTLPVIIGSSTVQAAYTGGFNSNRITFAYTVQPGDRDLDGIQLGAALLLPTTGEHFTDLSGNAANLTLNNVASTSGVFVHTGRPDVTLTSAAAARVNAPFTVTVIFAEAVTGFTLSDVALTNATVSNLQTTDNITYTVLVTPTADGPVSISIPADVAVNVAGNGNNASATPITRTYDATPPVIAAGLSFTVSQFSAAGTTVGTVTATDAGGTPQNWAIAADGSGGALQINAATGVISVRNTAALNALAGTNVTLGITVSDGLNTSASTPVIVRVVFVNQAPTLSAINNVAMCANTRDHTIQLTGASATEPGQTYTITATADRDIFDVLTVGAGNVLTYRLKANAQPGVTTVAVTIRDNGGTAGGGVDSLRRTFTLTVNAPPVITVTSDKGASISKGDIVKLTATGGSTYVWTAADGIISGQNSPVLEVRPMVNTTYEVTATTAAGCTGTGNFALSVIVDFKVDATNILTPNGDGRNDRWVIRNLDSYTDNEVKIFDRAGRMVYNRRNYSNDWDGTVNGSPLAEGTYYYILTIQNGAKTATGYITIVRDRY
jgi:gliding motility-associated-like protein